MTRTLLRNGVVYAGRPGSACTAIAVEDGQVVWLGNEERATAYEQADEEVDLEGRLVTPAFVDAHVHLVQTGQQATGIDLTEATSRSDALNRLAAHLPALDADDVLVGGRWDETVWPGRDHPTADDLERVAPGRRIYLSRIDGHSAIVSHALLAEVPEARGLDGFSEDGRLQRAAKHAVSDRLAALVGPEQRLTHARAGVAELARLGVAAFHECAAPHIGPAYELALVRRSADEAGVHATLYWGEAGAFDAVEALGVNGLAGDLVADGAVGSRTAALRDPYDDSPGHHGHAYLDARQIADHVIGCTERGLQAGFHCIGDAALDAVTEGFRRAADKLGVEAVRRCRHRLEHCEMPSRETIELMAELGIVASVQPMFDGLWGGPDRMYAARLGERWRQLNPFLDLQFVSVELAFGSDTPVTAPNPWEAVQAAVHHHNPQQRLSATDAFRAHTAGGWRAARRPETGLLAPGAHATYAVWDVPAGLVPVGANTAERAGSFPDLAPDAPLPTCLRTVVDGRTVFDQQNLTTTGTGR